MGMNVQGKLRFLCRALLFLFACGSAAAAEEAEKAGQAPGLPYTVEIQGVENETLKTALRDASALVAREKRPPESTIVLRRLAERDVVNLLQALRARAYYGAQVEPELDESSRPIRAVLRVQPGPQYVIRNIQIEYLEPPANPPKPLPTAEDLGLSVDTPALAENILTAQGKLTGLLKERGFPYPDALEPVVTADHATQEVVVVYPVRPGPVARFDGTRISGNKTVREGFLRTQIPWEEGELFDERLLKEYDKYLRKTGLFSVSGVAAAKELDAQGRVPVLVNVRERARRTVKAGVSYGSDVGLGARAGWENRNLFGRAEDLNLNAKISQEEYTFEALLAKPQFLRPDQVLRLGAKLCQEDTDAYYAKSASVSALVERTLTERLKCGTGLAFRTLRVRQFDEENTYNLFSAPSFFSADRRKGDLLNPSGGGRLTVRLTPFVDVTSSGVAFLRSQVTYAHYLEVSKMPRLVLAGRVKAGSITGAARNEVPADERFYAGGGGSIRGYEYQKVGPLRDDTPLGGRSLFEVSLEARARISERFGIVPFVDGGSVFESAYPTFGRTLRWGAGLGFRYFSPIGPIRLDVAVPLNARANVDKAFQIYISLGQAF